MAEQLATDEEWPVTPEDPAELESDASTPVELAAEDARARAEVAFSCGCEYAQSSADGGGGGGGEASGVESEPDQLGAEFARVHNLRSIRLTLVRHGQTVHNQQHMVQGQLESVLTHLGREEAKLLGRYFMRKQVSFDLVYTSDLWRAVETCIIVCQSLRKQKQQRGLELHRCSLLRERSYGELEGLTRAELRRRVSEAGHNPEDLGTFRPRGGETRADLVERAREFLFKRLFPSVAHLQRVLVVTHAGFIRETMRLFQQLGCPLANQDLVMTPNTAINNFDVHLASDNSVRYVFARRLHKLPHLIFNVLGRLMGSERDEHSADDEAIDLSLPLKSAGSFSAERDFSQS